MQDEAAANCAKEGAASRTYSGLEKALEASENRNADLVAKLQALQGQSVKEAAASEIREDLHKALEASELRNADLVGKLKAMQDEAAANHTKEAAGSQARGVLERTLEDSEKQNALLLEKLKAGQDELAASIAKEVASSEAKADLQGELLILKAQIAAFQSAQKEHKSKDTLPQTPPSPQLTSRTASTVLKASEESSSGESATPAQSYRSTTTNKSIRLSAPPQPYPIYRAVSVAGPSPGTGHANGFRQVHPAVQVPMAGKVVSTRVIKAPHVVTQPGRV